MHNNIGKVQEKGKNTREMKGESEKKREQQEPLHLIAAW
jgi:hypothetical protein